MITQSGVEAELAVTLLYKIYTNRSVFTTTETLVAQRYYIKELYELLFGKEEKKPVWMEDWK